MNTFIEFLKFEKFIAIETLILIYYFGAFVIPITLFYSIRRYRFFDFLGLFGDRNRLYFITLFIVTFLCCELFWRVGFEAIIGYFQMIETSKNL
jgi:hypothetical protein